MQKRTDYTVSNTYVYIISLYSFYSCCIKKKCPEHSRTDSYVPATYIRMFKSISVCIHFDIKDELISQKVKSIHPLTTALVTMLFVHLYKHTITILDVYKYF